jgi:hypothetical protein
VSNRLMRKSIAFLILLSCSSLALGQLNGHLFLDEASSSVPTYVDPDAYLVYSIVINSMLQQHNFRQETTVTIDDQTDTGMEICFTPDKEHKTMLASAIANYVKVNKVSRRLLPRFNLDRPYEIGHLPPDGVYLSSIGFNRGRTLAVVSATLAGSGRNYVLVKVNEKWRSADWTDGGCVWAS